MTPKLESIVNNYINGNKKDAANTIKKLKKIELIKLFFDDYQSAQNHIDTLSHATYYLAYGEQDRPDYYICKA